MINKELAKKVMGTYFDINFDDIENIELNDDGDIGNLNIYHYGVLLKEYLEDYAKSLHLGAVWIDLNDLSRDEAYYFKHCYEVYEQLAQYDLIMESEEL